MIFLNGGTYEKYYNHINLAIIDGNVINVSLINAEGKYGAIDADDSSCHGYYIIRFSSSSLIFKADLIIGGQVISYI